MRLIREICTTFLPFFEADSYVSGTLLHQNSCEHDKTQLSTEEAVSLPMKSAKPTYRWLLTLCSTHSSFYSILKLRLPVISLHKCAKVSLLN